MKQKFFQIYPVSEPRQAESLWFVDYKPHDTWELQ